ncbi:Na+/H+ antiporter [Ameyamaea chiangmaiensis NBRC 103196]|uniref:Sodium:proton antiporter n=1 Tax=Ameyamaea chiangmaiensis TaxID=442969 RepID=A0A850PEW8_9PROT|nr:sodium:proton antiporter [Ameyamaea chiangmaiensis]MBS4073582.1 sodium:proton antiporter [Ameyamaea chiangmaiensis]NVN40462.1 sodium:proton antiporter [Ameyamaea chiangmaiensis]GBQ69177.1 Na+/H+ antiporter [Ameyamaea chiangmaiensis NBRC 103196]
MAVSLAIGILCVLGAGVAAQWCAWRFRLPAIVLLFALGLVFGPGLGILHPSAAIGPLFRPAVSLAVAIIVFEGGLALDFRQWRAAGEGVLRLTVVALPINWGLGACAAHYVGHLDWGTALLFGSIIVVTGPTVVLPLLRHTKLHPKAAAFLRWEAILNDPVGAILATLVLEVLLAHSNYGPERFFAETAPHMIVATLLAIVIGMAPAYLVRFLFERDLMSELLKTPMLIAMALVVFTGCNLIMDGAGLMAATVFGMALANLRVPGMAELRRIKESLVVLVVSALFILLTADLQRGVLERLSLPIIGLTLAVLFVVRPLCIFLATLGSSLTWQERVFLGWIAPRGIVAAAVAGVAGLRLKEAGFGSADLITPAIFAVIAATMILHGFSLRPLARKLKLTLSDERALAIVGASPWSMDLARCLHEAEVPVLLVDTYSGALAGAARAGIPTLRAEVLSQEGEESLEERPADYLIAATPDAIYNGMVCAHLTPYFGRQRVFQVSPGVSRLDLYRGLSRDARGKVLGDPAWNFGLIERLFGQGWRFVALTVTEADAPGFEHEQGNRLIFLSVRRGTAIWIRSAEDAAPAGIAPGDIVVALLPPLPTEASDHDDPTTAVT